MKTKKKHSPNNCQVLDFVVIPDANRLDLLLESSLSFYNFTVENEKALSNEMPSAWF
ncbi:hypothetical protein [Dyadobacter flavalbus]|uniref:hypothetical protein n=1 Tax=Dyadobacter flavalbus TaxID=2579942 RepID=UPI001375E447|nr:hypothetical protein [Dyadobacter flavalbus]